LGIVELAVGVVVVVGVMLCIIMDEGKGQGRERKQNGNEGGVCTNAIVKQEWKEASKQESALTSQL
jgi:hypothetical protein